MSWMDDLVNAIKNVPSAAEKIPSQLGNLLNPEAAGQKLATGANTALGAVENPVTNALNTTTNPSASTNQLVESLGGLGAAAPQPSNPALRTPTASAPPTANKPEPLSYQAMLTKYFEPLIKSVGAGLGPSQVNQALGQFQSAPPSIGQGISSTLQKSIGDWQGGLQSMLTTLPEEAPQAAILAGMKSLLSYPITSLSGVNGAPPGVQSSDALMQLYSTLNAERNGQAPTSLTANNALGGSGYNTSINSITGQ